MNKIHIPLLALLAVGAASHVDAAPPKGKPPVVDTIVETNGRLVTLPSGINGILVYSECMGCPTRSQRTSSTTVYRFNEQAVTLGELRTVLTRLPKTNINVVISGKTRELALVDATNESVPAAFARQPANRKTQAGGAAPANQRTP